LAVDSANQTGLEAGFVLNSSSTTPSTPVVLNATENSLFAGGTVAQGSTNQKIGSYILTNNSNQDTTLGNIFFGIDSALYGGQPVFENIVAKVNNVQFGQTLASLSSVGAYAFAGNTPVTIPAGTSVTVDLYADVPINANDPSYINTVSLIENCSPTSLYSGSAGCNSVSGQSLTISGLTTLNLQASLSSSSPASGFVSGSASQLIADYNVVASGGSATIQEMDFSVVGSSSTPITAVTVGNSVVAVNSSNAVAVYGLNISVPVNGSGTNIPVSVNYAPVGVNGIPTGQQFTLNLTKVKCVDSNGIAYVFPLNVPSNQMTLGSQSVIANGSQISVSLNNALTSPVNVYPGVANQKIGSFIISNTSNISPLAISYIVMSPAPSNVVNGFQNLNLRVGGVQFGNIIANLTSTGSDTFMASNPVNVVAGGSVILDVYADVLTNASGNTAIFLDNINISGNAPTYSNQIQGQTVDVIRG